MKTLREICYEWYNGTSRRDWNGWNKLTLDEIRNEVAGSPLENYNAVDIRDIMNEIIAEDDELNSDDDDE